MDTNALTVELEEIKKFLEDDTRSVIQSELRSQLAMKKSEINESNALHLRREYFTLKTTVEDQQRLITQLHSREERIIDVIMEIIDYVK